MELQKTLVIIKPDGVKRHLVGKVISRFENVGLKLRGCKMVRPTKGMLEKHYSDDRDYLTKIGDKSLAIFKEYQYDAREVAGTEDPYDIGQRVREKLIEYMSDPVVAMIWEGREAVSLVRKMVGNTNPLNADVGTLRGDFSHDSSIGSFPQHRAISNVVHASGTVEEAKFEISLWFDEKDIVKNYVRIDERFY